MLPERMGIFDRFRGWFSDAPAAESPPPERAPKRQYENVKIMKPDGTTIEGHDAVKAHFEEEQQLLDEHGSTITFPVYRINPEAKTIEDLQGERLAEIKVDGGFASGTDTVAEVKRKLRLLVAGKSWTGRDAGVRPELSIGEAERISFSFDRRRMMDDKLFYADHFMLLPVWVQVLLHDCDHDELMEIAQKLRNPAPITTTD